LSFVSIAGRDASGPARVNLTARQTPGDQMLPVSRFQLSLVLGAACLLAGPLSAAGQTPSPIPAAAAARDGRHDFDFNIGAWRTHIHRRVRPLAGAAEMIDLSGTVTNRKIWGGRASMEEIEADGPNGHWEGMSLFLYNPAAHQWSQTFFNGKAVDPASSGLVGEFHDGRGELFSTDTLNGRAILVRGVWSNITPDAHRYQESYSGDGGRSWEVEFTADVTRAQP
jgi:hypothetical protein